MKFCTANFIPRHMTIYMYMYMYNVHGMLKANFKFAFTNHNRNLDQLHVYMSHKTVVR